MWKSSASKVELQCVKMSSRRTAKSRCKDYSEQSRKHDLKSDPAIVKFKR